MVVFVYHRPKTNYFKKKIITIIIHLQIHTLRAFLMHVFFFLFIGTLICSGSADSVLFSHMSFSSDCLTAKVSALLFFTSLAKSKSYLL